MNCLVSILGNKTTKINQDEASEWFDALSFWTDSFVKENFGWYVSKGHWPIKAQVEGAGEVEPKFTVHHHTSNIDRNYKPAMHRFLGSKKASSNFLVADNGDIFYLVPLQNRAYHATLNTWLPIGVRRALNIDSKWINEAGFEVAGNGSRKLFTHQQFYSVIVTQRFINALYPSITELKSHRFFSPKYRKGDPGPLYFLPLVEHASFNNINLDLKDYWLHQYKKNPLEFAKNSSWWIKNLSLEDKDEWASVRKRIEQRIDESYL